MLENINFNEIYDILKKSFESKFFRSFERQKNLLKNKDYFLITYKNNKKIIGFLSYWNLTNNIFYVEHLATLPEHRNLGIGKILFNQFLSLNGTKVLEVEPPHTEIDKRRIAFYEKLGLVLNDYEYYQPEYNSGDGETKLFLMSSKKLNQNEFNNIKNLLKNKVYKI